MQIPLRVRSSLRKINYYYFQKGSFKGTLLLFRIMEKLTIQQLSAKYSSIESKIPAVWKSYEEAGRELAQDLSFGHWDITDSELYRVVCLVEMRVQGLHISQHLDSKFAFMGLYPHVMKTFDITPE